jgi:hypothetical protein
VARALPSGVPVPGYAAPGGSSPEILSAGGRPPTAQPTCVALPGYRFIHCVSQNTLGDVWKALDPQGREGRALCLYGFARHDPGVINRLQEMRHPSLPEADVFWSPSGRLVVVTATQPGTLRDRFDACVAQGLPGIPRAELLGHLRLAAEALDTLRREEGLSHLCLNPRSLALHPDRVMLVDFGLAALAWLPTGQPAGPLNPRYAAPELFDGSPDASSDQYSLALVFAEMLTGVPVKAARGRPGGQGSGPHRLPRGRSGPRKVQPRVDLDLLPAVDREVLSRALHDDPRRRFDSCAELVAALQAVSPEQVNVDRLYHDLPAVIPFTSLMGEPAAPGTVLPSIRELVLAVTGSGSAPSARGASAGRYTVLPGGAWEDHCPIQVFPGALRLKIIGFRQEWKARLVREDASGILFHIELPAARRVWEGPAAAQPRLELHLQVQSLQSPQQRFSEVRARLRPLAGGVEQGARLLADVGPRLFESLRGYLQAGADQRGSDRWPCRLPLRVYPVRPDLELDEVREALTRNLALGGISFRTAGPVDQEKVYLHWYLAGAVSEYALLARVVRTEAAEDGAWVIGAAFPTDPDRPAGERCDDWR